MSNLKRKQAVVKAFNISLEGIDATIVNDVLETMCTSFDVCSLVIRKHGGSL